MPWIASNVDVIFFCFGRTFGDFRILELILLKLFGKKIIFTFHGCDARPPYVSATSFGTGTPNEQDLRYIYKRTKKIVRSVRIAEFFASEILVSPSASLMFRRNVINTTRIGNPVDEKRLLSLNVPAAQRSPNSHPIKILHCPSDEPTKGSKEIKAIVNSIKFKGYNIDYQVLSNVPNSVVLKGIIDADIVLDSLWNESPAGTLPAEAAFFGKPVIIGSYFADSQFNSMYQNKDIPPYAFILPEKFSEELERLVAKENYRKSQGNRLFQYMCKNKNLRAITQNYLKIASGNLESEYYFNPKKINYFNGYGADKKRICIYAQEYINRYGKKNLFLGEDSANNLIGHLKSELSLEDET